MAHGVINQTILLYKVGVDVINCSIMFEAESETERIRGRSIEAEVANMNVWEFLFDRYSITFGFPLTFFWKYDGGMLSATLVLVH